MKKLLTLIRFRNYSLRSKLLLSTLVITSLSIAIFGYFFYNRTQRSQAFLTGQLQDTVQQQSRQQLTDAALSESRSADHTLSTVTSAVQNLADYHAALSSRPLLFNEGTYWDGHVKLTRQPGGQYDNPSSDAASVFVPSTVAVDDALIADINGSMYLDFSAPSILKTLPDVVALYYIDVHDYTVYYPNIDLANNVPPDFSAVTQPFFTVAAPENDPDRTPKWTAPYQDPAGTGLIVTNAIPVYDRNNHFRGVLAADIQLSKIADHISTFKIGKTGFAFLIDTDGHLISMPESGYQLFSLQPEVVPVNETPKLSIKEQGPANLQEIAQHMATGEQGLSTITLQDASYYIAYTPLPTIGYSLGLVVPVSELDAPYLSARERISNDAKNTLNLAGIILVALLLAAASISFLLSRLISKPLVELTQIAGQISSGNLNVQAPVESEDEAGVLARTFNNMTNRLRETLEALEHRVADRTKALVTSSEVSRRLSTATSPRQLAVDVVEQVQSAFQYYHAHIYFLDEETGDLVMAGGTGEAGASMLARGHKVPKGRGLVGRAAETNAPVLVLDVSQAEGWLPNPLLPDTKSEVAIPISSGKQVLGVLDVQQNMVNGLSEVDVELLQSLAAQVAISLQNSRSLEESRAKAELESMVNTISQKIQRTASMEETLQTAIRELGLALGAPRVSVNISRQQASHSNTNPNGTGN